MKFRYLNHFEKVFVVLSVVIFFISIGSIFNRFFTSISIAKESDGGVYSEGMVGKIQFLNPVFADFNPIDKDISSLIFSGLTKYNPKTGLTEDDIATHTLGVGKKVYTFTLKDNVKWHDDENVTADDIMFTFQEVIQNIDFKNSLLRENFKGVTIKKINEKTVTFTLEKPYKFFLTNLTVGILPKHILEGIPIENLHLSEFNYMSPIGTGPYKVKQISNAYGAEKVILERNESYYEDIPKIHELNFYVFPTFELLDQNKNILDGIQSVNKIYRTIIGNKSQFNLYSFVAPQYVAAYFNTESSFLKDERTRLGLALGINKESILEEISEPQKIDTPFLELSESNWVFKYDKIKAQGSINDAGWKLPWKQEINETILEEEVEELPKFINEPNGGGNYATSGTEFFIEGITPDGVKSVFVNGYKLKLFDSVKKSFSYKASISIGTLKNGENEYKVDVSYGNDSEKEFLDSIKIFYSVDNKEIEEKQKEYDGSLSENKEKLENQKKKEFKKIELSKKQQFRINAKGEILELNLITSEEPKEYEIIAENLRTIWQEIGIKLNIEILKMSDLQKRVKERDYDILIFGQSLGYNLDSYPYWHSSQAKSGFNFSQLKNFEVDTLLEEIRSTHDEAKRQKELKEVEQVLVKEVPAVFFYTPEKYFALSSRVKGADFANLKDTRDRFSNIKNWYVNEKRSIKEGVKIMDFFKWILGEISNE